MSGFNVCHYYFLNNILSLLLKMARQFSTCFRFKSRRPTIDINLATIKRLRHVTFKQVFSYEILFNTSFRRHCFRTLLLEGRTDQHHGEVNQYVDQLINKLGKLTSTSGESTNMSGEINQNVSRIGLNLERSNL